MKLKGVLLAFISLLMLITLVSFATEPSIEPSRVGLAKDLIYFVFPDRYLNGDPSNDANGGFEPTQTAFFHGGDLKGLTGTCSAGDNGLARIKALGFTAIWLTPLVTQQPATSSGAGYHGYWGIDFLNVDPHLGTKEDLIAFMTCAKRLKLKIILDVVTNHTGDIIKYNERTPFIPADSTNAKNPNWLNDISNYHNVGDINSCWGEGSCAKLGDFYGLDDLATEKKAVYKGWAEVYGQWIKDYGISAFRVDTARHVDDEFFKNWSPLIQDAAKSARIKNFTIFGEVWDINPVELMNYVRRNKIQTVLDFPFQRTATEFASGYSDAAVLETLFLNDDLYTSATSDASNLVTFLGNHDMGRAGYIIASKKIHKSNQLLARTKLAHALMYFSRGIPVVYYGDEVGMTGTGAGNDQLARQDMFSTEVDIWKREPRIGSKPIGEGSAFSATQSHPIAQYLKVLAKLRSSNPGLANSVMQIRYAKNSLFVISKKDEKENREFVVAFNNSDKEQKIVITTATSTGGWKMLLGSATPSLRGQTMTLKIPALTTVVLKANKVINKTDLKTRKITIKEDYLSGYFEASAGITSNDLLRVAFYVRSATNREWQSLGVDRSAPYSVYIDPTDFPGKKLEIRASVTNSKGVVYEFPYATVSIPTS